jgi:hypothetical protein
VHEKVSGTISRRVGGLSPEFPFNVTVYILTFLHRVQFLAADLYASETYNVASLESIEPCASFHSRVATHDSAS